MDLALLVWAVDFFATASFFTLIDFIFLTLIGGILYCGLFFVFLLFKDDMTDEPVDYGASMDAHIARAKTPVIVLFWFAVFGSVMEAIIPDDKNTIYLMVGAYYTDKTIEDCKTEGTMCNRIGKKLEAKINEALDNMDKKDVEEAAQKVLEKTSENATK